jgi:hypothetical protein
VTSYHAHAEDQPTVPGGPHYRVSIFAGPDPLHRALIGTVTGYEDEARGLAELVNAAERDAPLHRARCASCAAGYTHGPQCARGGPGLPVLAIDTWPAEAATSPAAPAGSRTARAAR